MKEYLKIEVGEKIMYYPEFRLAEMTIMPWYNNKYRIDIELGTYDGKFNSQQKEKFENELNEKIDNRFSNICLRLETGQIPHNDIEKIKLEISDGGDEDEGGLVQLCVDWVIYLKNISIEFKRIDGELYTIWKGKSEDIDSYVTPGSNTTYELVAKIRKITELKDYKELLVHSKEIVKRAVRYRAIMSKMKGNKIDKLKLPSIKLLDREFEYNDSLIAWDKLEETINEEELGDPYK